MRLRKFDTYAVPAFGVCELCITRFPNHQHLPTAIVSTKFGTKYCQDCWAKDINTFRTVFFSFQSPLFYRALEKSFKKNRYRWWVQDHGEVLCILSWSATVACIFWLIIKITY